MSHLLALDQGTSSSRSIVFDLEGNLVSMAQRELTQHYPQPGWVEHDPQEIWQTQLDTAREAIAAAGLKARDIAAIGITNQRETTIVWNRRTGQPLHRAIVWQDRRTEPLCAALRERAGFVDEVRQAAGLVVDPYFSGTKVRWLLDHVPGVRAAAERGELAFGTVDSWLLWQLTGHSVHATEPSNASRTMLFDLRSGAWSEPLLQALEVPPSVLPQVFPSSHVFGETAPSLLGAAIPIAGIAGDQQAALFGQACVRPGLAKNTYGTGCFALMNTGQQLVHSSHGLVSTAAAQPEPQPAYALEGSVFVGGAVVQWLRDGLGVVQRSADVEALAASVPDTGGVMFVPAFTGLGAPYWRADARGAILGLTRGSTVAHIARAAVESIAFQSTALLQAMARDAVATGGVAPTELRVDGGACVNDFLMQFQADLLGIPVVRPRVTETTALGAAQLAGLGVGSYRSVEELAASWREERRFEPAMPREQAAELMVGWEAAVAKLLSAGVAVT